MLAPPLKLLLIAANEKKIKNYLGRIYSLSRDAAHKVSMSKIRNKYGVHPRARWGVDTLMFGDGEIRIGAETYLGRNCMIVSNPQTVKIVIGQHCAISHNVHIRTAVHKRCAYFKDEKNTPMQGADIIIGDYVWIGANVFIKGGCRVGANSIIGANSVVTQDIPPDSIYGGVPARLIRMKSEYLKPNE